MFARRGPIDRFTGLRENMGIVRAANISLSNCPCRRLNVPQAAHHPIRALGAPALKSQLSNQQAIFFNAVHHAVLIRYAA